jgi:signal transduction histidine kinase/CheY-like chemotaxis protein
MAKKSNLQTMPKVVVLADISSNAVALVERVLKPAGIEAFTEENPTLRPDALVVDVTQLMGDPLAGLRTYRAHDDDAPAIILAARFPQSRIRDFFRLGVADILLKPYRPEELIEAITDLCASRSHASTQEELARKLESSREQFRQRSEEIRLLSEIGRAVASLGNLEKILPRVVEAAAFVTNAEEANIYLAEPDSKDLLLRASKQAGMRHATLQRLRTDDTLVGQVFNTGQPVLRQPSLEAGPVKVQTGFLVRALAQVPIRLQNKILGVLGVYNRLSTHTFNEHHLTLLMALADWTGVALEHAELLRKSQDQPAPPQQTAPIPTSLDEALESIQQTLEQTVGPLGNRQLDILADLRESLQIFVRRDTRNEHETLSEDKIDLPDLIMEIVEAWKPTAERQGITLEAGPPISLPPFPGDRTRAQQVIETLTAAAIRRTKQGRVVLDIHRFEAQNGEVEGFSAPSSIELKDGPWTAVTVSDSGPGLPDGTIHAITSSRVDPSAGQEGPGLSIGEARLIAESMGGMLWHDQTPAGTTIAFAIPTA